MDQILRSSHLPGAAASSDPSRAESIVAAAADAVVILGEDSQILWSDERFDALPIAVQDRCRQWCTESGQLGVETHIEGDGRFWSVTIHAMPGKARCCLLKESSEAKAAALRVEAIDAAGMLVMHFDRSEIAELTVADRLKILEERIVETVKRELKFDNFEIRLRSPGSDRLELRLGCP